jgi:hypothetical protein
VRRERERERGGGAEREREGGGRLHRHPPFWIVCEDIELDHPGVTEDLALYYYWGSLRILGTIARYSHVTAFLDSNENMGCHVEVDLYSTHSPCHL